MNIVIIGSGIAGITFAEKMRQLSDANITVLTLESGNYYSRPMLSRGFSNADIEQSISIKSFAEIRKKNIQIIENISVSSIDRHNQQVHTSKEGETHIYEYDRFIIATGSEAFIPPPLLPYRDHFFLFNSLTDLRQLQNFQSKQRKNGHTPEWAIVGGGLIGCEVASDLAMVDDTVTIFHMMDRLMERQLCEQDSEHLLSVIQAQQLSVLFNQSVQSILPCPDKICITSNDQPYKFDAVILACGFKPRIKLAQDADIDTNRGIKVDRYLQSTDPNIYALGDVAELPDNKLYAYVLPIRKQALWLASFLSGEDSQPWQVPTFNPKAKVHGFEAAQPYNF